MRQLTKSENVLIAQRIDGKYLHIIEDRGHGGGRYLEWVDDPLKATVHHPHTKNDFENPQLATYYFGSLHGLETTSMVKCALTTVLELP